MKGDNYLIKKIIKKSTVLLLVALVLLSNIISVSAATIEDNQDIDMSKFGDVISNDDLGELYSYSGYVTKEDLSATLNKNNSVSASVHPTFDICYDTGENPITVLKAMASQYVGETALLIKINGVRAYCIEPGEPLNTGSDISSPEAYYKLSNAQRRAINVALCFGWEGNSSSIKSGTTINESQGYLATQLIIWEIVKGQRNSNAPYSLNTGCSGYLDMYCLNDNNGNIKTAYNRIVNAMAKYWTVPSITNRTQSKAPTYSLIVFYNNTTKKYDYVTESTLTLTDVNGVLGNFKELAGTYDVGNATVKATIDGNKLTLSCSNADKDKSQKPVSMKAEKTGIPTTSEGKLITYGSPTVQDTVCGGAVDPPNAFMNVEVNIVPFTETTPKNGYIRKTCWTTKEADDESIDEDEGKLNTSDNKQGWYFYVAVNKNFKSKFNYKKDYIVLGPTDEKGYTQTVRDYIKTNIDSSISDNYDVSAVQNLFEYWELGRLKDGATGEDLLKDYYMPSNVTSYSNTLYADYIAGKTTASNKLHLDSSNSASLYINEFKIPLRLQKTNEDGASAKDFYFTATNNETGDVFTLFSPRSNGYAHIVGDSSMYSTVTDKRGYTAYDNYLPEGTYTIHELGKKNSDGTYTIPAQYDVPADIEVEISADAYKSAQDAGYEAIQITFTNTTSSYIAIEKKDKDTKSFLANAVYGIYSDKSCNNLLEKLTTDNNGYAQSEHKYGTDTYYVKEITSPDNYKKNDTVYTVIVSATSTAENVVLVEAEDEHETGYVAIHKSDSRTGSSVEGAVYGLYSSNETDSNGILLNKNKIADDVTTDSNGKATFSNPLRTDTTYYIQEIKEAKGYTLNKQIYEVVITADNTTPDTAVLVEVSDSPTITAISKKDISGTKEISGAKLKVTNDNTTIDEWTSSNKEHLIYNLEAGKTYTLTEVIPAQGYVTAESIDFTVNTDGSVTKVTMKDAPTQIEFIKVDENDDLVSNVKLQVLDSSKNVVDEWVTDGVNNHIITGKLIVGNTYYLHEVSAPADYELSADISFIVKDIPDVQTVTMINKHIVGSVKVIKQDENGIGLAGSEWQLYNSDGTQIKVTQTSENTYEYDTSGSTMTLTTSDTDNVTVTSLPLGSYYLVESKAPDGRMPYGEKIAFEVSADSTDTLNKTITVKDNHIVLLDTGGIGHNAIFCFGGIGLILAILTLSIIHKKSKKHDCN